MVAAALVAPVSAHFALTPRFFVSGFVWGFLLIPVGGYLAAGVASGGEPQSIEDRRAGEAAMRIRATRARHTNALMHAVGHFKKRLDTASRDELLAVLEDYRNGLVPRIVPRRSFGITLAGWRWNTCWSRPV